MKLFFLDKKQRLHYCEGWRVHSEAMALHAGALWLCPAYWLGIRQPVSRTGQNGTPHPFHQLAPWSLPWILKQTGFVLWLPTQPKGGGLEGGGQ